jgi:hypothetical protein
MHEARVARQAANPVHSEVKLGEGSSSIRVKLIEVHGQALGSSLWESGALLGHVLVSLAGKELVSGRRVGHWRAPVRASDGAAQRRAVQQLRRVRQGATCGAPN